jgi:hypothetical protein
VKRLIVLASAVILGLSSVLVATAASPHEGLSVSPLDVGTPGDGPTPPGCSGFNFNGDTETKCTITVKNSGTEKETWSAQVVGDDGSDPTTFSPDGGSLAPGKSVKVTVETPDCGFQAFAFYYDTSGGGFVGEAVLYTCG